MGRIYVPYREGESEDDRETRTEKLTADARELKLERFYEAQDDKPERLRAEDDEPDDDQLEDELEDVD